MATVQFVVPTTTTFILSLTVQALAILYPQDSEVRETKPLDGLWTFVLEPTNSIGYGFQQKWWKLDLSAFKNATVMPVPSSYNDVGTAVELRDHVGWAWYQRQFYIPTGWKNSRIVIRFGSVNYYAMVWVNGKLATSHVGGHLPFEADLTDFVIFDRLNTITVTVNNTLNNSTIPPGEFQYKEGTMYPEGFFLQTPDFDFFNYAGIHRSVVLYRTAKIFIEGITVQTNITNLVNEHSGLIQYNVAAGGAVTDSNTVNISVIIIDRSNRIVGQANSSEGKIKIPNAILWWPRGMNQTVGYLYDFQVDLLSDAQLIDRYTLKIGIRTVEVTKDGIFKINTVPFYFKGCGMHEDSEIRGRGFDYGIMNKDMNLLEWLDANSFRSSHYPYSEERMMEADRRGIVVVDETPAVGLQYFTNDNLQLHKEMLTELIDRDKNHPSVVMWSLANEPKSHLSAARSYFRDLLTLAHELDKTRPVTIVYGPTDFNNDKTGDMVDVLGINRYYGWYSNMGHLEIITLQMIQDLSAWRATFRKPILVTEYGADSIAGLSSEPAIDFTETYQVALMKQNHLAFDQLKTQGDLIGEMFWNFADFMTAQSTTRAVGNRKGVFTRNRQPKMAAYLMKQRYASISSIARRHSLLQQFSDFDFF